MINLSTLSTGALSLLFALSAYSVHYKYAELKTAFEVIRKEVPFRMPLPPTTPEQLYEDLTLLTLSNSQLQTRDKGQYERVQSMLSDYREKYHAYAQALRTRTILSGLLAASGLWSAWEYVSDGEGKESYVPDAIQKNTPYTAPRMGQFTEAETGERATMYNNPGEGDCGYYALSLNGKADGVTITRDDAVIQLAEHRKDEAIRELISHDIIGMMRAPHETTPEMQEVTIINAEGKELSIKGLSERGAALDTNKAKTSAKATNTIIRYVFEKHTTERDKKRKSKREAVINAFKAAQEGRSRDPELIKYLKQKGLDISSIQMKEDDKLTTLDTIIADKAPFVSENFRKNAIKRKSELEALMQEEREIKADTAALARSIEMYDAYVASYMPDSRNYLSFIPSLEGDMPVGGTVDALAKIYNIDVFIYRRAESGPNHIELFKKITQEDPTAVKHIYLFPGISSHFTGLILEDVSEKDA